MNNNDLKRLSRRELVEIIYQLKKNEQQMKDEMAALEETARDKRMRISVAGSIAEAATDITNMFSVAQLTADLYLHEIASMKEDTQLECAKKLEAANEAAEKLLADAEKQCAELQARYQADYKKWQQLQAAIQQAKQPKISGSCEDMEYGKQS